ncbi:MAG TPA: SIS domain-containing protein [Terriglobales bacterium]|nr:SIS domain-containing protein [Terriglobales bacterium]
MSDNKDGGSVTPAVQKPGTHSISEILSQPHCWTNCLKQVDRSGILEEIVRDFKDASEWIFVGCGSSYYVAQSVAFSWTLLTGLRARAVPASELLLFPDTLLTGTEDIAAVVISRSGQTSEAVAAAGLLEKEKGIRTLAVSCAADRPLEHISSSILALLPADEESTVMTRSFTSMLLGLQYLASHLAGNHGFGKSLHKLAPAAEVVLPAFHSRIRDFVQERQFADYICLGQGPFFGIASECALKITEMSLSYAQNFHALEFRHGPKSVVGPETLIMFLLSETGYEEECEVLQEIKSLGGTTLAIANRADERARAASDLVIEFGFELPELARLAPYTFAGQLIGLYTGLKKGVDPDNPRHLTRVVILDENSAAAEPSAD